MPKMRWADPEAFDDLPDEWDESEYTPYEGDDPPGNVVLRGNIKKMWATQFQSGNDGVIVLFEADGNSGEKAEYDGWAGWDRIAFTPGSAFRYGPLMELLGVTLSEFKNSTVIGAEDNVGFPVTKVGSFRLGDDGFPCKIRTKVENDEEYGRKVKPATYMPDEKPKRKASSTKAKSRAASGRRRRDDDDDEPF